MTVRLGQAIRQSARSLVASAEETILPRIVARKGRLLLSMYRGGGSFAATIINLAYYLNRGVQPLISEHAGFLADRTIFSSYDRRGIIDALKGAPTLACEARMLRKELRQLPGDVRIAVRLRQPLDQAKSYAYFLYSHGFEPRDAVCAASEYCREYYEMLRELLPLRPLVLQMEDMAVDPATHFRKICAHLDIPVTSESVTRALDIYGESDVSSKAARVGEAHPRTSYKSKTSMFTDGDFAPMIGHLNEIGISEWYRLPPLDAGPA